DGTLLNTEYEDDLDPRVSAAIARVRDAGHLLVLCTGRSRLSAARVIASAAGALDGVPQILLNGAMVIDGGSGDVLREAGLPRDVLKRLVELFRGRGVLPLMFTEDDAGGGVTIENQPPNSILGRYLERRRENVGAVHEVDDLLAHLPASALEIGTIDLAAKVLELEADIRRELGDAVQIVKTETLLARIAYLWLEVYRSDCTKGSGLALLADAKDVPRERIVAIGDNYNDLDMFAAAGHRVAMGNAPEAVRSAADRIAPDVARQGAAVVLEEIAAGLYPGPPPQA
ncbi:HAD hydrolase family protein, partial [bacterium]|nr:HAD hydrolase family protein [bacterium]